VDLSGLVRGISLTWQRCPGQAGASSWKAGASQSEAQHLSIIPLSFLRKQESILQAGLNAVNSQATY